MNIKVIFQHAKDYPLASFFSDFCRLLKYLVHTTDNVVEIEYNVCSSLYNGIPFIKENEEIFSKLFLPYKEEDLTYEKEVYLNNFNYFIDKPNAQNLYNNDELKLYTNVFNKYIKLQPHIQEKINNLENKLTDNCEEVIGIFMRSNALACEQPYGIIPKREDYLKIIKDINIDNKKIKYFLRIDNNEDLEFYKDALQPNYYTQISRSKTNNHDAPHQNNSDFLTLEDLENTFIEIVLLSKCDTIIHCVSNMAAASLIMNPSQKSILALAKKKKELLVFMDPYWSIGRVNRNIELYLKDEYNFTFVDWNNFDDNFLVKKIHLEYDIILTGFWIYYKMIEIYKDINLSNWIFIAHGFSELHPNNNYSLNNIGSPYSLIKNTNYAVTSDCLIDLFPKDIKLYVTPNGVEPSHFTYIETTEKLEKLGWCGAPAVQSKNINWAIEITKKTNLQLSLASRLSFEKLKDWYHSIDLLIVTAGPNKEAETGPLPPFEAIVSGTPVIGTPVGNFRHIPGPKFNTIEEAVTIIEDFKLHPEKKVALAKEQYDYVIKFWTYKTLSDSWRTMFNDVIVKNENIKNKLKTYNVIFAGPARNVEKYIKQNLKYIDECGLKFNSYEVVIFENDSTDNTKTLLLDNKKENYHYIFEENLLDKKRTVRLAYAHNKIIDKVRKINKNKKYHYLILLDLDNIHESGFFVNTIDSCFYYDNWDGMFCNQIDFYYDIWTLRIKNEIEFDCWKKIDEEYKNGNDWNELRKTYVGKYQKCYKPGELIEVISAFGGLGIYKLSSIQDYYKYIGEYNDGTEICQHVIFNDYIIKNGGKLYINTSLITGKSPSEHDHRT